MPLRFIGGLTRQELLKFSPYFLLDTTHALDNVNTQYWNVNNARRCDAAVVNPTDNTEANTQQRIPYGITVTEVRISLTVAPGVGNSYTFVLRDDGADTAVVIVITGAATVGTWTGLVNIAADSLVCWEDTPAPPGFPAGGNGMSIFLSWNKT
jgi:hypothetical protein